MQYRELGREGLKVSLFGLGTMTWGSQNSEADGHAQIDVALEEGVTLIDTAEMYPTTPLAAETAGDTERIIGSWLAGGKGRRERVVLATKITGSGNQTVGRNGAPITPETLRSALDGSLRRLRTDHIDLYQVHWPNRGSYHFRQTWTYAPDSQARGEETALLAILETIGAFVAEGKVRAFGLSNETAWGTATLLKLAERHGLPRVVAIQNEYSLLHRLFDTDLAELCHHEDVGLLAYSPLAAGFLTGKYQRGARPAGTRATMNDTLSGRINRYSEPAVDAYLALARAHGLDVAQMALAFAASRPFMGSVLLGATTVEQLQTDLGAADLTLTPEVMAGIAAVRREYPNTM